VHATIQSRNKLMILAASSSRNPEVRACPLMNYGYLKSLCRCDGECRQSDFILQTVCHAKHRTISEDVWGEAAKLLLLLWIADITQADDLNGY